MYGIYYYELNFVGYHNILRRMTSHNSLTVIHENADENMSTDYYSQLSVRYTLYSGMFAQRAAFNHQFFSEYLQV